MNEPHCKICQRDAQLHQLCSNEHSLCAQPWTVANNLIRIGRALNCYNYCSIKYTNNFLFILWQLGLVFNIRTPPITPSMHQDPRASIYKLRHASRFGVGVKTFV